VPPLPGQTLLVTAGPARAAQAEAIEPARDEEDAEVSGG
jgi:hypothetical protein